MTIAFHDGNIQKESASFPCIKEPKRCVLSVRAAFGNITSVYGHIDENGRFVRKMRFAYGQIIKNEAFVRKFE
ncbi:MAG: hypothetical protein K6G02_08615 [Lactobacillus sp.]|nr:hypothetical protein [Lactobacillus sp.]